MINVREGDWKGVKEVFHYTNLEAAKLHCVHWKHAMEALVEKKISDNYRMLSWVDYWRAPVESLSMGYKWHDNFCVIEVDDIA